MKFKNIKKKIYKKKSPSNSRKITEHFKISLPKINSAKLILFYRKSFKYFVIGVFIIAVVIVGYDLQRNLQARNKVDFQRDILIKELKFWENFIAKQQNYRDAYLQASILEYKLGDTFKAKVYAQKALVLDPNSTQAKDLEKFLKDK